MEGLCFLCQELSGGETVQSWVHVNLEASIWKDFASFAIVWRSMVQHPWPYGVCEPSGRSQAEELALPCRAALSRGDMVQHMSVCEPWGRYTMGRLRSLCHCPEWYYGLLTVPSVGTDLDGPTPCHGGTGMGTRLVQHLEDGRSLLPFSRWGRKQRPSVLTLDGHTVRTDRPNAQGSKSASLSVTTCSGRGYHQLVQVDSLMIDHDFDLNWRTVHVSPFLCQSVSAFSGRHVVSHGIWQHSDAPVSDTCRSRKYWEDQQCAMVSSWLPNELNSASCVWTSRSQSSSEWITS